jgi:hypothetical protein
MSYRIAGVDVHKKMLAVVVSDVEVDGEYHFERRSWSEHLHTTECGQVFLQARQMQTHAE